MNTVIDFFRRTGLLFLAAAAMMMGAGFAIATTGPGEVRYSGRAIVVDAQLKALTTRTKVVLADTGELDGNGATRETTVVTFDNDPPIEIHSKTATAIVAGENDVVAANAAVEKFSLKLTGLNITADVIEAHSSAECHHDSSTVSTEGTSHITNLVINGMPIKDSNQPNTVVANIPGVAKVILNRQVKPDVNTLWVSAIRVEVPGFLGLASGTVDISRAEAGILTCNKF